MFRLFGSAMLPVISRASFIIGQLVFLKIVTHNLSIQDLGVYYLLVSVGYFFNALIFIPMDYYQQAQIHDFSRINGSIYEFLLFNLRSIAIVTFLSIVISPVVVNYSSISFLQYAAAYLISVATYAPQALRNAANTLGYSRDTNYSLIVEAVTKPLFLFIFMNITGDPVLLVLVSNILSLTVGSMVIGGLLERRSAFLRTGERQKKLQLLTALKIGAPISVSAALNWLQLQGFRIILTSAGYVEVVGIYSSVSGIGHALMGAVSSVYNQIYLPKVYQTAGEYFKKYVLLGIVLCSSICIGAGLFSNIIVRVLTTENLSHDSYLIIFGILIDGINFLIGAITILFTIRGNTKVLPVSAFVAAISSVAYFSYMSLQENMGPTAIGVGLLLSQLFALLSLVFFLRKKSTTR